MTKPQSPKQEPAQVATHAAKHKHKQEDGDRRLICMCTMVFIFFWVELGTGVVYVLFKSLALVADAVHMLSDSMALIIGLMARKLSRRPTSAGMSYGWGRTEILGGFFNAVFLLSMAMFVTFEAIGRFLEPELIENPQVVLIVGGIGLLMNIVGVFMFHSHGHSHSHDHAEDEKTHEVEMPDVRQATLTEARESTASPAGIAVAVATSNVVGTTQEIEPASPTPLTAEAKSATHYDSSAYPCFCQHNMVQPSGGHGHGGHSHGHGHSHGKKGGKKHEDDVNMHSVFLHVLGDALGSVAVIVSVRQCAEILLQFTPESVDARELLSDINKVPGVHNAHDLHVWRLAGNNLIGTVHLSCTSADDFMKIAVDIKQLLHNNGVHATTIQPEFITEAQLNDISVTGMHRCDLMCSDEWGCRDKAIQCCSPPPPDAVVAESKV